MKTAPAATALLISGALLGGCSGDAQLPTAQGTAKPVAAPRSGPATPSTSPAATSTATIGKLTAIPDGTWARTVSTAEITRRGLHLTPQEMTSNYLDDGRDRVVLKTQGSRWSILVQDDAGAYEVGDLGTTSYDSTGRWVQGSDSAGGGTLLLAWKVNGDTLVTSGLSAPKGQAPPGDGEHVFLEGNWKRQK